MTVALASRLLCLLHCLTAGDARDGPLLLPKPTIKPAFRPRVAASKRLPPVSARFGRSSLCRVTSPQTEHHLHAMASKVILHQANGVPA